MLKSVNYDWKVKSLVTVGEKGTDGFNFNQENFGYNPVGIFDGLGAVSIDKCTSRVFSNHEVFSGRGLPYFLQNGISMTGGRIDSWDLNRKSFEISSGRIAYDTIFDRENVEVTNPQQLNKGREFSAMVARFYGLSFIYDGGFLKLCSGGTIESGQLGFTDTMYCAAEEYYQGMANVTSVSTKTTYVAPMLGQMFYENFRPMENYGTNKVVLLLGDDSFQAPLWLYVGEVGARPPVGALYDPSDFLVRNGLGYGRMYAWVANNPEYTDEFNFFGTGNSASGKFIHVKQYDASKAGVAPYDNLGFLPNTNQYQAWFTGELGPLSQEAFDKGAFEFVRVEDIASNPKSPSTGVFATTGSPGTVNEYGKLYTISLDDSTGHELTKSLENIDEIASTLTILYDSSDNGGGQVPSPKDGIRSPDNLEWATDGYIYVNEDLNSAGFCEDAPAPSNWRVNPYNGEIFRITVIDRNVPEGQIDVEPEKCSAWENSGIVDVSKIFHNPHNKTLLLSNVQAHTIEESDPPGLFSSSNLVEGSQMLLIEGPGKMCPKDPQTCVKRYAVCGKTKERLSPLSEEDLIRERIRRDIGDEDLVERIIKIYLSERY